MDPGFHSGPASPEHTDRDTGGTCVTEVRFLLAVARLARTYLTTWLSMRCLTGPIAVQGDVRVRSRRPPAPAGVPVHDGAAGRLQRRHPNARHVHRGSRRPDPADRRADRVPRRGSAG